MEQRQDTKVEMKSRKKRADDGDLDITPMIDITFLLLAFFVVVSKMDPSAQVSMPEAKYGDTVPEETAVVLLVRATDGDIPIVFRGKADSNASSKCTGTIEEIETQIEEYCRDEMQNDAQKVTVIIKAEKTVKFRHLDIVKRAVSGALAEEQVIHVGIEEN